MYSIRVSSPSHLQGHGNSFPGAGSSPKTRMNNSTEHTLPNYNSDHKTSCEPDKQCQGQTSLPIPPYHNKEMGEVVEMH